MNEGLKTPDEWLVAYHIVSNSLQRENDHVYTSRKGDVIGRSARGSETVEREQVLIPLRNSCLRQRLRPVEDRATAETIGCIGIEAVALHEKELERIGCGLRQWRSGGIVKSTLFAVRAWAGAQ